MSGWGSLEVKRICFKYLYIYIQYIYNIYIYTIYIYIQYIYIQYIYIYISIYNDLYAYVYVYSKSIYIHNAYIYICIYTLFAPLFRLGPRGQAQVKKTQEEINVAMGLWGMPRLEMLGIHFSPHTKCFLLREPLRNVGVYSIFTRTQVT